MTTDLRSNPRKHSSTVTFHVVSENDKEYWCYPSVKLCDGSFPFGTLYLDKDSLYGKKLSALILTESSLSVINDFCLEIMCKHLSVKDLHSFTSEISYESKNNGMNYIKQEFRRLISYV